LENVSLLGETSKMNSQSFVDQQQPPPYSVQDEVSRKWNADGVAPKPYGGSQHNKSRRSRHMGRFKEQLASMLSKAAGRLRSDTATECVTYRVSWLCLNGLLCLTEFQDAAPSEQQDSQYSKDRDWSQERQM
jgi:exoribonuclease R